MGKFKEKGDLERKVAAPRDRYWRVEVMGTREGKNGASGEMVGRPK